MLPKFAQSAHFRRVQSIKIGLWNSALERGSSMFIWNQEKKKTFRFFLSPSGPSSGFCVHSFRRRALYKMRFRGYEAVEQGTQNMVKFLVPVSAGQNMILLPTLLIKGGFFCGKYGNRCPANAQQPGKKK